jgi:hypothetical protein
MATTTNYGWTTPDDTALVKDGAAAIRTLGSSVDTTTKALNPSTTLGDIEYRSSTANTNTRLGIGTTGQVLAVSGGVPAWTNPSGKVLQVVNSVITTTTAITATSMTDTSITLAITPTSATSKVLVMISAVTEVTGNSDGVLSGAQLMRGATQIADYGATNRTEWQVINAGGATTTSLRNIQTIVYLDAPATTSSTTYKLQAGLNSSASGRTVTFQRNGHPSTITLFEIGA